MPPAVARGTSNAIWTCYTETACSKLQMNDSYCVYVGKLRFAAQTVSHSLALHPVYTVPQATGRMDFEQFVSALLDLGGFKGWDGERVLKAVRCLNIEGHMYTTTL